MNRDGHLDKTLLSSFGLEPAKLDSWSEALYIYIYIYMNIHVTSVMEKVFDKYEHYERIIATLDIRFQRGIYGPH